MSGAIFLTIAIEVLLEPKELSECRVCSNLF